MKTDDFGNPIIEENAILWVEPKYLSMHVGDTFTGTFEGVDEMLMGKKGLIQVVTFSRNEPEKYTGELIKQLYSLGASYKISKFFAMYDCTPGKTVVSITLTAKNPHPKNAGLSLNDYVIKAQNPDGTPVNKKAKDSDVIDEETGIAF